MDGVLDSKEKDHLIKLLTLEKKYSTWLLRLFSKSKLELSDLPVLSETITMHLQLKDSIPVEFRDINKFDSAVSFLHSMNVWLTNRFVENENNMNLMTQKMEEMRMQFQADEGFWKESFRVQRNGMIEDRKAKTDELWVIIEAERKKCKKLNEKYKKLLGKQNAAT